MTTTDVTEYLLPAMLNLGYPNSYKHALELERLLGYDEYAQWVGYDEYAQWVRQPTYKPLSEEYKKQLIALAGPHGKTILKMIRINKGLE